MHQFVGLSGAAGLRQDQRIGLFTTLPILWNEAADVGDFLKSDQDEPHWAKTHLGAHGTIVPLDTLAAPAGSAPLDGVDLLFLAQPRPLSPDENVALDTWVRGGGRVLLLADPALTQESGFAIGDPRRPQAVALLSPILRRWGLELQFDDAQPFGDRAADFDGVPMPTNLAGRFALRDKTHCKLRAEGLIAVCAIGRGRVVALADAAVLEPDDSGGVRAAALTKLMDTVSEGR